ncbi:MAG TPA: aminoacetone oxidase family FAD-binding enzyme [Planctomycetes bacterium]|nr:aminoacetone oxidase family FAD-binding enzyme [Planctomycetota bacterium]
MPRVSDWDVCIIGGGAAGLFCAATAARRGRRVVVLDHATIPGRKILISGGGRCNFTNRSATAENYLSANPHFCRSALARFTPQDFLALVEARGIAWEERRHGQLFCVHSAKDIVALLLDACAEAGVTLRWGVQVQGVAHEDRFRIDTTHGPYIAERLVVATGGLPVPSIGASDFGLRLARQFGHGLVDTAPALAPLLLPAHERLDLPGIAVDAEVRADGPIFRENLLFTHGGISGPSVLQASSYWRPGRPLHVDLLPGHDLAAALGEARAVKAQLGNHLADLLPRRLLQARLPAAIASKPVSQLSRADIAAAVAALTGWELHPEATGGWLKAEVMRGGVDTAELSSQTMESRRVPGLHFIGEVIDVTGWLGGYNFQWAWASGHACGMAV